MSGGWGTFLVLLAAPVISLLTTALAISRLTQDPSDKDARLQTGIGIPFTFASGRTFIHFYQNGFPSSDEGVPLVNKDSHVSQNTI